MLNVVPTLDKLHRPRVAVKTETQVEVQSVYLERFWNLLMNEASHETTENIQIMIEAIQLGDHIKSMRRKMAKIPEAKIAIEENHTQEIADLLYAIRGLYEHTINDPACRDQST